MAFADFVHEIANTPAAVALNDVEPGATYRSPAEHPPLPQYHGSVALGNADVVSLLGRTTSGELPAESVQ